MGQPVQTLLQIAPSLTKIRQQIHFNKVLKVLETVILFRAKAWLTTQKHKVVTGRSSGTLPESVDYEVA